jgi:hypothetical protein
MPIGVNQLWLLPASGKNMTKSTRFQIVAAHNWLQTVEATKVRRRALISSKTWAAVSARKFRSQEHGNTFPWLAGLLGPLNLAITLSAGRTPLAKLPMQLAKVSHA